MSRVSPLVLSALALVLAAACGGDEPAADEGLGAPGTLSLAELRARLADPAQHTTFAPRAPLGIATRLYGTVPASNPLTPAKVELGRQLFFDARLSRDGGAACASCHRPERAWSGPAGRGGRAAPSLANRTLGATHGWDGGSASLEEQALSALSSPLELDSDADEAAARLNAIEGYRLQFESIFGGPATAERIARALAAFERTLLAGDSPHDRFAPEAEAAPEAPEATLAEAPPADDAPGEVAAPAGGDAQGGEAAPIETAAAVAESVDSAAIEGDGAEPVLAGPEPAPATSGAGEHATQPAADAAAPAPASDAHAGDPRALEAVLVRGPGSRGEERAEPPSSAAPAAELGDAARRGRELFLGRARCATCHSGENLSDERFHNLGVGMDARDPDLGRFEVTGREEDRGAFKTPGLRDVALTAPYLHDDSAETLLEALELHARGGEPNPWLSRELAPLELSEAEALDLVAFLEQGLSSTRGAFEVPPLP